MFFMSKKALNEALSVSIEGALRRVFLGETEAAKLVRLGQELDKLRLEIEQKNKDLAKTKLDHQLELQEIQFLQTKKDEMADIEKTKNGLVLEKKQADQQVELAKKEATLQKEYFTKTEQLLDGFRKETKETFESMLKRITLEITKDK